MFDAEYITLEKVARQLNLPKRYIRDLTKAGKIPHLIVGGRMRFNLPLVQNALLKIAESKTTHKSKESENAKSN